MLHKGDERKRRGGCCNRETHAPEKEKGPRIAVVNKIDYVKIACERSTFRALACMLAPLPASLDLQDGTSNRAFKSS